MSKYSAVYGFLEEIIGIKPTIIETLDQLDLYRAGNTLYMYMNDYGWDMWVGFGKEEFYDVFVEADYWCSKDIDAAEYMQRIRDNVRNKRTAALDGDRFISVSIQFEDVRDNWPDRQIIVTVFAVRVYISRDKFKETVYGTI